MTALEAVLLFVGIPLAFITLMALIVLAPGWTRAGSYRPGEPWPYEPLMINGSASTDVTEAIAATPDGEIGSQLPAPAGQVGGASARW